MSAPRCPHCHTVLTATEAAAGSCPECAGPLPGGPAAPVATESPAPPTRSRFGFPAGLIVGLVLGLSGAGAAWWAWGPDPFPAAAGRAPEPADREAGQRVAEELAQAEVAVRDARAAARQADVERAATEHLLATARDRVQAALGQLAAAEKERTAVEARLQTAKGEADSLERANKEVLARPRPAPAKDADPRPAEAQRAAAERALADARNRLQAVQAQQADADRQLAAAQTRLQAVKARWEEQTRQAEAAAQRAREATQQAEAQRAAVDRSVADARNRLQTTRDQAAAADRELAEKKTRLADRDRALEAKRAQLADLDRAVAAKGAKPVEPPAAADPPPAAAAVKPKTAFARDWLVVGPFPDPGRKGHATAFPPEAGPVDPKKEYDGATGPVRWRAHASAADYVDLAELFKTQDPAVGYAVCWVRPARARSVVLSLGSNDGIKVWVNGKLVTDRAVSRSAAPGQDRLTCELTGAWNELRVKVDNTGGPWGFYLEARDAGTDKPLAGLEYRTTPPEPKKK